MVNETNLNMYPPNGSVISPWFNEGYLLGYSNSGFTNLTRVHIDDFKIYTQNPEWPGNDNP